MVTLSIHRGGMWDGVSVVEACQRLEKAGADVVGLNCMRGPKSTLPLLKDIVKAVKVHNHLIHKDVP